MPTVRVACKACGHVSVVTYDPTREVVHLCPVCGSRMLIRVRAAPSPPAAPGPAPTPLPAPGPTVVRPGFGWATEPGTEPLPVPTPPAAPPPVASTAVVPLSLDNPPPLVALPTAPRRGYGQVVAAGVAALLVAGGAAAFVLTREKAGPPPDPTESADRGKLGPRDEALSPDEEDDRDIGRLARPTRTMPSEELFRRLTRATVFVFGSDPFPPEPAKAGEAKPAPNPVAPGWVFNADRNLVVTRADILGNRRTAWVVLPVFNDAGVFQADWGQYRSRAAVERNRWVYEAEVVEVAGDGAVRLAALRLRPKDKQRLPADLDPLPLSDFPAAAGEKVYAPDVGRLADGTALTLADGTSQGLVGKGKEFVVRGRWAAANAGGPVVNARGEVVAVTAGPADGDGTRGTDVAAVRAFLEGAFRTAGWPWSNAQAAAHEPKDKFRVYAAKLKAATAPGHLIAAGVEKPEPAKTGSAVLVPGLYAPELPADAKARQMRYLRRIGQLRAAARDVIQEVADYLRSPDPDVRVTALEALLAIRGLDDLDQAVFASALRTRWSTEAKTFAAWAYGTVAAPAEMVPLLGELLIENDPRDERARLRVFALRAIANNKVNAGVPLFRRTLEALDDRVGEVREAAKAALVVLGEPILPWMVDDMEDKMVTGGQAYRRQEGWDVVEHQKPLGFGRLLAAAVLSRQRVDSIPYARFRKLFYERLSEQAGADDLLVNENHARGIRVIAAEGLSKWGREAADSVAAEVREDGTGWKGLTDLLTDPIESIRLAAVRAVKAIGVRDGKRLTAGPGGGTRVEPVDLPAALDELADGEPAPGVRKEARDAAVDLVRAAPDRRDVALLRKYLRPIPDPVRWDENVKPRRLEAARVLAALLDRAGDSPEVVGAVAAARPELITAAVQPEAEGKPDKDLQVAALRVLVRVAGEVADGPGVARVAAAVLTGDAVTLPPGGDPTAPLLRSTVWVRAGGREGAGVVVGGGDAPLVVTAAHLVTDRREAEVYFPALDKDRRDAAADPAYYAREEPSRRKTGHVQTAVVESPPSGADVAVLRLPRRLPAGAAPARFAPAPLIPGQTLHLCGMGNGLWRRASGTVARSGGAGPLAYPDGRKVGGRVVEHTIRTAPGDSGGPVANDRGELVGIACAARPDGRAGGFAVDKYEVETLLRAGNRAAPTAGGPADLDPDLGPAVTVQAGPADPDAQKLLIRLLEALGPANAGPLAETLRQPSGRAHAKLVCDTLRRFAERYDPADHPNLVSLAAIHVIPTAHDLPVADAGDAAGRLVATVGGIELVYALRDRTPGEVGRPGQITRTPLPVRLWATRTLGRVDPAGAWLRPAEVRRQVLANKDLRVRFGEYVQGDRISDEDAGRIRDRVLKDLRDCLVNLRDRVKNPEELRAAATTGLLLLERPGVK